MSLMLTDAELQELTGYVRMADQRKWLQDRGWRFEVSSNGKPIVGRNYADAQLGAGNSVPVVEKKRREWKPNIAAIKKAA